MATVSAYRPNTSRSCLALREEDFPSGHNRIFCIFFVFVNRLRVGYQTDLIGIYISIFFFLNKLDYQLYNSRFS